MQKLAEFFDSLLQVCVTYPVTMVRLLFSPGKMIRPESNDLTCPASIAMVISISCFWWTDHTLDRVLIPDTASTRLPSLFLIGSTLVMVALTLLAALLTVRYLFRLKGESPGHLDDLRALSYPVSAGLLTYTLMMLLAISFPKATMYLAPLLDQEAGVGAANLSAGEQFYMSVTTVSGMPVSLVSIWSMYNVLRTAFGAGRVRAILATIVALLGCALVIIMVSVVSQHLDHVIKQLASGG